MAKTTGSRGNWLTGHLIEFGRDPLTFLRESSSREGDFISLRFFSKQARIINSTAAIEDVLATRQRSFLKARGMTNRIAERLFGNGLLTSEGATWTRQRRLVQPAFHRKRIAGYADAVVELSEALIADWKDGDRRSVHDDMVHYTTQVISRTLFGSEPPEAIVDLEKASLIMMERMGAPPSLWRLLVGLIPRRADRRIMEVLDRLDAFLYGLIAERRRQDTDRGDILSLLINARDEQGEGMDDRQLRDEMSTLLVAGLDTTVLALSWACYLIARHPAVADSLESELSRVLQGRSARFDDLPSLPYTEAVIKETMRLYPPAWMMVREAVDDCVVGGHQVRRGTMVMVSPWLKHRDPRTFEDPEVFRPERWLEGREVPRFAYLPFGGGPRICVGNAFAMMEAPLTLATICQKFRFACDPGYTVTPWPAFTLQPRGGIHLEVRRTKRPGAASDPDEST